MKKLLLSAASAALLTVAATVAQASGPVSLTDQQLDKVTAGTVQVVAGAGSIWSAATGRGCHCAVSFAKNNFTLSRGHATAAGQFGWGGGFILLQ